MSVLTYDNKTKINQYVLQQLATKFSDKEAPILPEEGKVYYLKDPVESVLAGSIGAQPNEDYTGPQPPNSMGMVLLVEPNENGDIEISLDGRFDYTMRMIPAFDEMVKGLKMDEGDPKPSQTILSCYVRRTFCFESQVIRINAKNELQTWKSAEGEDLQTLFEQHTQGLRQDPRIFKECQRTESGNAKFFFDWHAGISDQDGLNNAVNSGIFSENNETLLYSPKLKARLRKPPSSLVGGKGKYLLELYLVNHTTMQYAKTYGIDQPFLLDVEFQATVQTGQHHFLPHKLAPVDYEYYESDGVPGYGITCGVEQVKKNCLKTTGLPTCHQPVFDTPAPDVVGMSLAPSFEALACEPIAVIDELVGALKAYNEEWIREIATFKRDGKNSEADEAERRRQQLVSEIERIEDGGKLLSQNDDLLKAFKWMNASMKRAIELQKKPFATWRLFQLGFILTQIRAIYERHCSQSQYQGRADEVDVLWFSTGGGKTEAYLGIICMAMLYGRMQGRLYGTTAWMRFPLRMLSVQQFQRLSYVLAQANIIRHEENLGGAPFTIGYLTGNTPKKISDHVNTPQNFLPQLEDEQLAAMKFISDCPYCEASHSIKVVKDIPQVRIKHVCTNPECWTNTTKQRDLFEEKVFGEVGLFVSDEECYRYAPTVLVGTVDKLAVIAHNTRFKVFFGASKYFCPEHGFTSETKCQHHRLKRNDEGRYEGVKCGNTTRSKIRTIPTPKLLDPGFPFLIQDELHLLRENLGNFDSHYETLLCSVQKAYGGISPKTMAATATIKDYESHINHLYQREARRFPSPGIKKGESFYSRKIYDDDGNERVRRHYVGLLPIGRGSTAMRSVAEANHRFFLTLEELKQSLIDHPGETVSKLGLPAGAFHEIRDYLAEYFSTSLIYVNSKRNISDLNRFRDEIPSEQDRKVFQLTGESSLDDIFGAIETIETKSNDDPPCEIIATNVVSHGVDINRLNFMVLAGWPKSMAEYIQSSARAGRVQPGIVLTVLKQSNLYECNVFMDFNDFHFFMDKLVESVPINRFAPNVLERTFPGVVSACVLLWASEQAWGGKITHAAGSVRDALNDPAHDSRTALKSMLQSALEVPDFMIKHFDKRVVDDFDRTLQKMINETVNLLEKMGADIAEEILSEALRKLRGYGPMRSFRDIENQVEIIPKNENVEDKLIEALAR